MTKSKIIPFPIKRHMSVDPEVTSVWVLFVLEDLREHFQSLHNDEASRAIEYAIQKLEPMMIPHR